MQQALTYYWCYYKHHRTGRKEMVYMKKKGVFNLIMKKYLFYVAYKGNYWGKNNALNPLKDKCNV